MPLTLPVCDVLCVVGSFEKQWLEDNRYIVVLDPVELFSHERVRTCSSNNEESMKQIAWEFVFMEFGFLESSKALEKLKSFVDGVHLVASDFKNRGLDHLENFLKNQKRFPIAREGKKLFGAFKDIPAVICGAGPSLEDQIPTLRKLQNKALIFAGGTALSALSHFKIQPHFAAFIDPHPPQERLFAHQYHQTPTFFQNRTHPDVLEKMRGELLWMPGAENDLFENEHFDGGWNVATFLIAIAAHLGCNPIQIVGVDLAETSNKTYAADLQKTEGRKLIALEDGNYTQKDWLFAKSWIEEFQKTHPEINWNQSIESDDKDLNTLVLEKIQSIQKAVPLALSSEKLKNSFKRMGKNAEKMLELLEKNYPTPIEKNPEILLLDIEMEKELSSSLFLTPVWNIWKHVFARQIPKEIPEEYGLGLNKWLFMKGICDDAAKI